MASRFLTDDQLKKRLLDRASRLVDELGAKCPNFVMMNEIALIVTAARLLFGREQLDQNISEHQRRVDLVEAGICPMCTENSVLPPSVLCETCEKSLRSEFAEDLTKM